MRQLRSPSFDLGAGHVPASYAEYLQALEDVLAESVRTLEPGGRIAVNVANLGRPWPHAAGCGCSTWSVASPSLPPGSAVPTSHGGALGRAAAAHTAYPQLPLVLATPDPPRPGGPAATALTGWAGARKPVRAIIDLNRLESLTQLRGPAMPPLAMDHDTLVWLSSVSAAAAGVAAGMDLPLWEEDLNSTLVAVTDRANDHRWGASPRLELVRALAPRAAEQQPDLSSMKASGWLCLPDLILGDRDSVPYHVLESKAGAYVNGRTCRVLGPSTSQFVCYSLHPEEWASRRVVEGLTLTLLTPIGTSLSDYSDPAARAQHLAAGVPEPTALSMVTVSTELLASKVHPILPMLGRVMAQLAALHGGPRPPGVFDASAAPKSVRDAAAFIIQGRQLHQRRLARLLDHTLGSPTPRMWSRVSSTCGPAVLLYLAGRLRGRWAFYLAGGPKDEIQLLQELFERIDRDPSDRLLPDGTCNAVWAHTVASPSGDALLGAIQDDVRVVRKALRV